MIYLGKNAVGISDTVSVVPIDDTAGVGDTTKVWSADKSYGEISDLKSAINVLEDAVDSIHEVPAGGTSGQILTKVSGTDYDVQWSPVGMPSDAQVDEAVSDWLDDHPEATTTVEDGAITLPKFAQITKNTVVITEQTEKNFYHDVAPELVTFYPNQYTQAIPIKYIGSEDLFRRIPRNSGYQKISDTNSVYRTVDGRFTKLEGTGNGGLSIFDITSETILNTLKGKTINICLYINKADNWRNGSYFALANQNGSIKRCDFTYNSRNYIGWNLLENITIPETTTRLRFNFNDITGSTFSEGDFIWIAAYEALPTVTEITITNETETLSINGLSYIDTMMHESVADYIVPTKTYVDEHTPDIIGYWNDNVYAMPEKFGAVGDGVTDDATALANCMAYAKSTGKAVRGYGKYKTSAPVEIDWQFADVYLKEINYTGNQCAVDIQHMYIQFSFHMIQSANVGINMGTDGASTPHYARQCQVYGTAIQSDGDCIVLRDYTLYDTFEVRNLSSANGNCIRRTVDVSGSFAGEFVFRSSSCACPNGYVGYNVSSSKFYDFTVEGNCKYGLLNPTKSTCIGWRHREQTDKIGQRIFNGATNNNGPLIIFTRSISDGNHGFKFICDDSLPYYSIDLSAIQNYDTIPSGQGSTDIWRKLAYTGIDLGTPIRGYQPSATTVYAEKMYFIGDHKVFAPPYRSELTFSKATYDMSLFESTTDADIEDAREQGGWATDFIAGYSHTDYYCNASFGAVGYNDITITQKDGNTVTFFDKLGNAIFDGTNLGNGKWRLTCTVDRESTGRLGYSTIWWCYDGTNEKWEITKLE